MASIFIGVPRARIDTSFGSSLYCFRNEIEKKHWVESRFVYGKRRDEARRILVEQFLDSGCDYLLFLDDDHTGHRIEMLDGLMGADAYVASIKCYARYFPFQCTLMTVDRVNHIYFADDTRKGYMSCDLVGFGMALIKRETFDLIDRPFFECDPHGEREDNYFCDKLIKAGVHPIGYFDYVLPHCGIDDRNIDKMRDEGLEILVKKQHKKRVMQSITAMAERDDLNSTQRETLKIIRQNFKEEIT